MLKNETDNVRFNVAYEPTTLVVAQISVVVDAIPDLAKDQKAPEPVMVQVAVSGEGMLFIL